MKAGFRHLSFLALTAALLAPAAVTTRAAAQDDRRQEDKRQEDTQRNDRNQTRVYDRTHKDYHDWNENEDRSYREYAGRAQRPKRAVMPLKLRFLSQNRQFLIQRGR
jgi:ribulose kinase